MRIAVTGIGILSGIGRGADETLDAIKANRTGLGPVTLFDTIHGFPVSEVKLSNADLSEMLAEGSRKRYTRTALLGMAAARDAMEDSAQRSPGDLSTGLVSSTSVGGMDLTEKFFRDFMSDPQKGRLRDAAGHGCYDSTDSIAQYCGIEGFRTTISTACSSAVNAIMFGARMIRSGRLDRVVVGGTDSLCAFTLNGFHSLMILDGEPCRPFDQSRAGLNLGEGAAYLVLQSEDTLEGDPYCYLTGWANANDAHHQTASSPEGRGAYLSMKGALEMSGKCPGEIDYINVHGTGTRNNDASEAAAIQRLFRGNVPPVQLYQAVHRPYTCRGRWYRGRAFRTIDCRRRPLPG